MHAKIKLNKVKLHVHAQKAWQGFMPKKFAQSKFPTIQRIKVLIHPKNLILRILMFAIIYRRLQKMRYYRVSVTNRERLLSAPGSVLTKTTLTGRPLPVVIKTSTGRSSVQTALIRPSCLHLHTCTPLVLFTRVHICEGVKQSVLSVCQSICQFVSLSVQ